MNNSPVPLVGDERITTIFLSQTRERVSERAYEKELLRAAGRYYVVSEPTVLLYSSGVCIPASALLSRKKEKQ